jgi:glycosyltransferase involved in cell wall biosynthesis
MKIVAIIPAYNEEKTIQGIVRETKNFVSEVIVVDDNSKDKTKQLALTEGADVISHKKNMGYGSAVKTGFGLAINKNADIIVLLDADAQHNPSEIKEIVKPIFKNKADLVIGSRFLKNIEIPTYRRFGIKFFTILIDILTGLKITDAQSGFRVFSRNVLKKINLTDDKMGISVEVIFKAARKGFRIVEVPVTCQYKKIVHKVNPVSHGVQIILSILIYFIKTL